MFGWAYKNKRPAAVDLLESRVQDGVALYGYTFNNSFVLSILEDIKHLFVYSLEFSLLIYLEK